MLAYSAQAYPRFMSCQLLLQMMFSRFTVRQRMLHVYQGLNGVLLQRAAYSKPSAALSRKRNAVNIAITGDGKKLRALWDSESSVMPSTYHSVWLRHNCQCPQCLSSYNQTVLLSYELDPKVAISEAHVSGEGHVQIKWSCGHEGHLNLDWLRRHCYSSHSLEKARKDTKPTTLTECTLPMMDSRELEDEEGIWRWLKTLNDQGLCLLTEVPCTDEGGFKIPQAISPHLQETIYGGHNRIEAVENPTSIGFDSRPLEPHMDVPMHESHPGVIFLQCLRNDECVEGGESIIVDALAVVEKFRVTHPHHFSTLVRVPATFHRIHYDRDYPVHMVYRTPHFHLNGHGQVVKLRWSPHNLGPLQVAEEDVELYYEAFASFAEAVRDYDEFRIYHRLQPGDVLVVNNHRMLHGRTPMTLNGGVRLLNNFIVNIDEFKSRFMVLCAKYDPDYQPKSVLNHDFSFSTAARC